MNYVEVTGLTKDSQGYVDGISDVMSKPGTNFGPPRGL